MQTDAQIKISSEELARTDHKTSVALADGSGYVAELGVYHWLHCLVSSTRTDPSFHLSTFIPLLTHASQETNQAKSLP